MELWQTVLVTAVGFLTTAAMVYIGKSVKVLHDIPTQVNRILALNEIQTKNITTIVKVQRPIIRALRSHSYALKECGANGSVVKALERIGEAEDLLNGRATEAIEEGMHV